jgi:hypothetical protein
MMGIYFSATTEDIQQRDFISPARIINWNQITNSFSYDYLPVKSQLTPHYRWRISTGGSTIFGTQTNDWATDTTDIYQIEYQKLDRLSSPYPIFNSTPNNYNARGYLYADDSTYFTGTSYDTSAMILNSNPGLGGAPWYFYFGLIKGSTAINRFYSKYIGETVLNE